MPLIHASGSSARFDIAFSEHEVFNTCWVANPTLTERASGAEIFALVDTFWSVDTAKWLNDDSITFVMRKYPGNHRPVDLTTTIDCAARVAELNGEHFALERLEARLEAALHWLTPEEQIAMRPKPPLRARPWWKLW